MRRFLTFLALALALCAFTVPRLTGPVVDTAHMLSPAVAARLDEALRAHMHRGGSQIAVLTVPSLEGEPIEQASIEVVEAWKLGTAKADDGVLLFIARDEHRLRIEVGQGLEGDLPDAIARRIIDDVITPKFRAGDVDGGVLAGVAAIAQKTDPELPLGDTLEEYAAHERVGAAGGRGVGGDGESGGTSVGLGGTTFLLLFAFLFLVSMLGRRRRRRGIMLAPWGWGSGGGSSWGGGGGGGFGGGGGGFSGGGASGGW